MKHRSQAPSGRGAWYDRRVPLWRRVDWDLVLARVALASWSAVAVGLAVLAVLTALRA